MLVKILNNSWLMEEIEVEITCYLYRKHNFYQKLLLIKNWCHVAKIIFRGSFVACIIVL